MAGPWWGAAGAAAVSLPRGGDCFGTGLLAVGLPAEVRSRRFPAASVWWSGQQFHCSNSWLDVPGEVAGRAGVWRSCNGIPPPVLQELGGVIQLSWAGRHIADAASFSDSGYLMCLCVPCLCFLLFLVQLVVKAIAAGDQLVLDDARRIGQYRPEASVDDPGDLANRLFHTVYMGTENSSVSTRSRWGRS